MICFLLYKNIKPEILPSYGFIFVYNTLDHSEPFYRKHYYLQIEGVFSKRLNVLLKTIRF